MTDRQPEMATYKRFGGSILPFSAVRRCAITGNSFIELIMVENVEFAVEILTLSVILPDINISGFGGHVATSGCWSLLQSLTDTFFELYDFAIGILILVVVSTSV